MSKKLFTAIFALAAMPGLALAQDIPSNTLPAFPISRTADPTRAAAPGCRHGGRATPCKRPRCLADARPGASCSRAASAFATSQLFLD